MNNRRGTTVRIAASLLTLSIAVSIVLMFASLFGCNATNNKDGNSKSSQELFPKGQLGAATNFTGNAYNFGLVANDSIYNTLVGNVFFEAGARSNWHTHPSGQILIIVDGEGYHQIEGQPRQTMKKGDVVKCPPRAKHWHGATEKNGLTQMYIVPNTENGIVTWMEPVPDSQYQTNETSMTIEKTTNSKAIFERGELLSSEIITGKAWHKLLLEGDSIYTTALGSEEFEPGSRNVWHSHPGGQIIVVTDGVGYHQIERQPVEVLRKGDIAKCPPGVKHWHGASKNSSVTEIYIVPNTENGVVNWFQKVTDEEYNKGQ